MLLRKFLSSFPFVKDPNSASSQNKGNFTEISTVSCTPQDSSKYFSNYVTVSYWGENEIEVLTFDKQGFVLVSKSPPLPALVRSAILYNFGSDTSPKGADYHPHVLAGLGDGSVVYFAWKDKQFKEKKIISLGRAPVSLTVCQVDGKRAVFAAGNRATVLSWEKKRLHTSPIMLKVLNYKSIHLPKLTDRCCLRRLLECHL